MSHFFETEAMTLKRSIKFHKVNWCTFETKYKVTTFQCLYTLFPSDILKIEFTTLTTLSRKDSG